MGSSRSRGKRERPLTSPDLDLSAECNKVVSKRAATSTPMPGDVIEIFDSDFSEVHAGPSSRGKLNYNRSKKGKGNRKRPTFANSSEEMGSAFSPEPGRSLVDTPAADTGAIGLMHMESLESLRKLSKNIKGDISGKMKRNISSASLMMRALVTKASSSGDVPALQARMDGYALDLRRALEKKQEVIKERDWLIQKKMKQDLIIQELRRGLEASQANEAATKSAIEEQLKRGDQISLPGGVCP